MVEPMGSSLCIKTGPCFAEPLLGMIKTESNPRWDIPGASRSWDSANHIHTLEWLRRSSTFDLACAN
jgi:hypothetical protein